MHNLSSNELTRLLKLQLLIARAGQRRSLKWWEDESMTDEGAFILDRVFAGAPQRTAQRLSLRAAASRHAAALADVYTATHLFRLDPQRSTDLALRGVPLPTDIDLQTDIRDMADFRERLLSVIGTSPEYEAVGRVGLNSTQQIRLPSGDGNVSDKAAALAWAYTAGKAGHPVFPYFKEQA